MSVIDIVLCKFMAKNDLIEDVRILGAFMRKNRNEVSEEANAIFENGEKIVPSDKRAYFEIIQVPLNTLIVDHIEGPENVDEAIESMIRAGYIEAYIGEDGEFYYKPKENRNV